MDDERQHIADFWVKVNECCLLYGGSITSGIRSSARNHAVGGHPQSRHLLGLAADIDFLPDPTNDAKERCDEAFEWFYDNGLYGYQRSSGTALHIQDRSARAPKEG